MIKKVLLVPFILALFALAVQAQEQEQTVAELKAQKAEKMTQIAALKKEANSLQAQIDALPGWDIGALGTIGFSFSRFNNWLLQENPNTETMNIGFVANAFANYDEPKYFWNNSANLSLGWTKLDNNTKVDEAVSDSIRLTTNAFNITSLFGYKINNKLAISALGEYRSSLGSTFNDPGYLDLGVGATWTPIPNAVVVFHPLNYNFIFSSGDTEFVSSLGCKIVADYSRALPMGVAWKTNFSAFISYSDAANFSNWTWVNGFSFTAWKGIGVGIDFGLRNNRQEAFNAALKDNTPPPNTIKDTENFENMLQTYWIVGLTYKL